jgi:hypothetical protein
MTHLQDIQAEEAIMRQYEVELANAQQQASSIPYQAAMFGGQQKQNLVELQLDIKPDLENIERALRCDVLVMDEKQGREIWIRNPEQSRVFMNDLGVNDVIRMIIIMINKHKFLSNYREEEVSKRVKMIVTELRVLIYNNYEDYGIDNDYKMNNYSMMVIALNSMIEDAYRRAIKGAEHRDLNQNRLVTQNEMAQPQMSYSPMMPQQNSRKSIFKPWTWGK